MTEELNERNFDRMVDGELNDEEQSRLLSACDEDPSQWRSLALAYVEAQTWRSDFLTIRAESEQLESKATPASREKRQRLPTQRLLNVAAMLFLSLAFGFGMGALSFTGSSGDPPPQLASQQATPKTKPSDGDDEILVLVQNQQTSELQRMKVPLVNISDINTGLTGHHRIPSDVWRSLQNEGHNVSHQRQWYPVRLNDGRSALVPIDSLRVMFDGFQ